MLISNELNIKGETPQNDISNYRYDKTKFSIVDLLKDDIYTIRIVAYGDHS